MYNPNPPVSRVESARLRHSLGITFVSKLERLVYSVSLRSEGKEGLEFRKLVAVSFALISNLKPIFIQASSTTRIILFLIERTTLSDLSCALTQLLGRDTI
jgi:hypothetical protein